MEQEYEILDKIINVAFVNLFTISKKDNIIRFSEVKFNDEKHWALLNLIALYSDLGEPISVYLDMPLFSYWKLRRKIKHKNFKRVTGHSNGGMTCDEFISNLEEANKQLIEEPFLKIAKYYYPRKGKR